MMVGNLCFQRSDFSETPNLEEYLSEAQKFSDLSDDPNFAKPQ